MGVFPSPSLGGKHSSPHETTNVPHRSPGHYIHLTDRLATIFAHMCTLQIKWTIADQKRRPERLQELANGAVDLLSVVIQGFILSAPMFGRVHKHPDNDQEPPFPTETPPLLLTFASGGFCPPDDPTLSVFTEKSFSHEGRD